MLTLFSYNSYPPSPSLSNSLTSHSVKIHAFIKGIIVAGKGRRCQPGAAARMCRVKCRTRCCVSPGKGSYLHAPDMLPGFPN